MNAAQIINYVANLLRKARPKYIIGSWKDDSIPTSQDKPSPASDLKEDTLMKYLRDGFPNSYRIMRVADTNSMEPFIDDNSRVVCQPVTEDYPFRPGMVCIYDGSRSQHNNFHGKLILHRIEKVDDKYNRLYFAGDNNQFPDGWVAKDAVLYNVIAQGWFEQLEDND